MIYPKLLSCLKLFEANTNFLLITHKDPDGDAIGSMTALAEVFLTQGKQPTLVCPNPLPQVFTFLPHSNLILTDPPVVDWDLIITMDCGDLQRAGFTTLITQYSRRNRLINIDHHPKSDLQKLATVHLGGVEFAATAQILLNLFKIWSVPITRSIATSLLTGLYTDTGGFKHTNTNQQILKDAAFLLEKGARLTKITHHLLNNKPVSALKLWGIILGRLKTNYQLKLAISVITLNDLKACQASLEDLAGAVNLMNTIPSAKVAILLAQISPDTIKASLRTEDNEVDVSRIAEIFGGGGHKKASGFTVPGRIMMAGDRWKIVSE